MNEYRSRKINYINQKKTCDAVFYKVRMKLLQAGWCWITFTKTAADNSSFCVRVRQFVVSLFTHLNDTWIKVLIGFCGETGERKEEFRLKKRTYVGTGMHTHTLNRLNQAPASVTNTQKPLQQCNKLTLFIVSDLWRMLVSQQQPVHF